MEVKYWSTLTTRGKGERERDVSREEEAMVAEVEKVCIAPLFPGR